MLTLNIRGADVSIPEAEIERLWLAGVREPAASTTVPGLPAIGSPWSGGIYAGIMRGDAGQRDYHLIVNTAEAELLPWESAKAWAASLEHDGNPWALPNLKELAVLFGNVPELFTKDWYWSGEKYAPVIADAWAQYFTNGLQISFQLNRLFRARAVRRLPI